MVDETIEQIAPDFTRVEVGESFPIVTLVRANGVAAMPVLYRLIRPAG
jgi:hypothetical protein